MVDKRLRPEIFSRLAGANASATDAQLQKKLLKAAKLRGISPEVLANLGKGGNAAIWSKSYTESESSRLNGPDGRVLLETTAPLSKEEQELIDRLGLDR